jgi:hypothetical protein
VDAAYEEADTLNGSKEAAALQAAEAAGSMPPPAVAAGQAAGAAAAPAGIAAGRYQLPSSGNSTADKVAAGLVLGGAVVATAVGKAAAATANAISNYASKQVASGKPNEKPATISPTFKTGCVPLVVLQSVAGLLSAVAHERSEWSAAAASPHHCD